MRSKRIFNKDTAIQSGLEAVLEAWSGLGDISALYRASRSLSILFVAIGLMWRCSKAAVEAAALIRALVQAGDTGIGVLIHDAGKTIGPLVLAIATGATLVGLVRTPETAANAQ